MYKLNFFRKIESRWARNLDVKQILTKLFTTLQITK